MKIDYIFRHTRTQTAHHRARHGFVWIQTYAATKTIYAIILLSFPNPMLFPGQKANYCLIILAACSLELYHSLLLSLAQ